MNKVQKLAILNLFNRALLENRQYDECRADKLLKFGVVCSPCADFEVICQVVERCQKMLYSGVALTQETIENMIN